MALDSEVRVRSVGQAIYGKTIEPVYAFGKLLIPAGTVVNGKVSAIDGVSRKTRALDATDGNFSPARHVHVQFDELVMGDGRHVALQTGAPPAPDGVLQFVTANEKAEKKNKVEDAASKKVSATRQEIRRPWNDLRKQNGSVVHAWLVTALNSSTAKKGDPVEALITEPLVVSDHMILPEGSVVTMTSVNNIDETY